MADDNFELPKLNPLLKLTKAPNNNDGSPSYTLHNPISSEYFRIGWAEFECLSRFHLCKTADELITLVNSETSLVITMNDIKSLLMFLNQKGQIQLSQQSIKLPDNKENKPLWQRLIHGYLFFTLPILKAPNFLEKSVRLIKPFLNEKLVILGLINFIIAALFVAQRSDEFISSIPNLFTAQGIILGLIVFAGLKIIHELAHAYTATNYGVKVPHMGIAFIVMYPILYTETSGSWQLSERKQRLHIGLAGILAELCLAGIFLWLWSFAPAGSLQQSLSFTAVLISCIGSLLVNLNPLMRFDGYYILCDYMGLDNLQHLATQAARWHLRRILFGLQDPWPKDLPQDHNKFLIAFGYALLIYRFFLFLGIAFLVYHVFPKPLGPFLMVVELYWFIGKPIFGELKVWHENFAAIKKQKRAKTFATIITLLILYSFLPLQNQITLPAIQYAKNYKSVYPIRSSQIKELLIRNNDFVKTGDHLATLETDELDNQFETTKLDLDLLIDLRRRFATSGSSLQQSINEVDDEIARTRQALKTLQEKKEQLIIKAPFDGRIKDLGPNLHAGRYVSEQDLLFRIVDESEKNITAYIDENNLDRITIGQKGNFTPYFSALKSKTVSLRTIDETNTRSIPWAELTSIYNGPIPANLDTQNNSDVIAVQGLYALRFVSTASAQETDHTFVKTGYVRLKAKNESLVRQAWRNISAFIVEETNLN